MSAWLSLLCGVLVLVAAAYLLYVVLRPETFRPEPTLTQILLILLASIVLAFPLGLYLARVMRGGPMRGDALFGLVEKPLYRLLGVNPARGMSWRGYVGAFLLSNVVIAVLVQAVFMTQAWLPFNPDQIPNMRWDTALHTMVSFLTNTNQQHYSGQAQLSYLSQMTGITGLQVVTPMMGLALVAATAQVLHNGLAVLGVSAPARM